MTMTEHQPEPQAESRCPHLAAEAGKNPGERFGEPAPASSPEQVAAEARAFLGQLAEELGTCPRERMEAVIANIRATGTYELTTEELTWAARIAWRNNTRCIGRLFWKGLKVRDERHLTTADEIFASCVEHLRLADNGGKIKPLLTVFAPARPGAPGPRIWNHQLVRYAGYRQPDGSVVGDPASVEFTERARALGWDAPGGRFDLLPLIIQLPGQEPALFELPPDAVREVEITHPEYAWFAELELRWYAVPIISDMRFDAGGVNFPAAPFSGWYMSTEIASRNFADADRFDMLPEIARRLGLDTSSPRTMWQERALVELNVAVLESYKAAGVTMVDHHTASEEFVRFAAQEEAAGRTWYSNRSWIVPPTGAARCPTWSMTHVDEHHKPNFFLQPSAY